MDGRFIRLINYDKKPIFICAQAIDAMRRIEDLKTYTRIYMNNGNAFSVAETPETILKMMGYENG